MIAHKNWVTKTHHSPVLDLGLEDVLDRHLEAVPDPHAGVDGAEAALAQDGAEGVGLLERLGGGTANGVTGHNCKKKGEIKVIFHSCSTYICMISFEFMNGLISESPFQTLFPQEWCTAF